MTLRLFIFLLSMLALVSGQAQIAVGTWKQYPVFGEVTDLVETDRHVWYATGGCLYSYDKNADETRFYSGSGALSGYTVKLIRHDSDKGILAVAYADGNMDLILSDGSRVNLPEIRDAGAGVDKTINDISFDGGDMFVATGGGLVIYDTDRYEVRESRMYNVPIRTVIPAPGYLILAGMNPENGNYALYGVRRDASINIPDNFRLICRYRDLITDFRMLDTDGRRYAVSRNGRLGSIDIGADGECVLHDILLNGTACNATGLTKGDDGVVRFITKDGIVGHYSDSGTLVADIAMPEQFRSNLIASHDGLGSVWFAGEDGIGNYRIEHDGGLTVLREKSVPSDAITFNEICNIFPTSDNRGFYISNLGMTQHHPVGDGDRFNVRLKLNLVTRDGVEKIDPVGVTANTGPGMGSQSSYGKYIFSPTQIAEDPDNAGRLYIGSGCEGVYVIEDGVELKKFDNTNSTINKHANYYCGTVSVTIDNDGNLWVCSRAGGEKHPIAILPADKRRLDPSEVTMDDWAIADYDLYLKVRDIKLLHCRHSGMIFGIDATDNRGFLAVNHRGTPADPSDDIFVGWSAMTDQDGKSFAPQSWTCLVEDQRGHVWFGTRAGVVSVTNPAKACNDDFRINRIKVPRNDGSGLADYLLDNEHIVAIAVDSSNRKWIGTNGSGLYLVSEDGDEIISHFTTDNSPLPSNVITALYCDPNSSSLFVGTLSGLYEYSSTSSPPRSDYSDVYAYPNPVTSGYSGPITITGLMEDSLVKIMDSGMRLVYQTSSEGGMAVWDGCNIGGTRVRSGVYYVLASSSGQGAESSAGDVVAKILVVN